jgi:hypothetical protein
MRRTEVRLPNCMVLTSLLVLTISDELAYGKPPQRVCHADPRAHGAKLSARIRVSFMWE